MKLIKNIAVIFIFIIGTCVIIILLLSMNFLGHHGPYEEETVAKLFSEENIIQSAITAAVILAIGLPIEWAIKKRIGKNKNE
jgi:formate hydrogenlyase subunit 3/multisubunit Na+/H+ antiporter MnhD subunit